MEGIPPNALPMKGQVVDLLVFVDSDHGDKQTKRSRTGFMIYLDLSLNNWYSKQ